MSDSVFWDDLAENLKNPEFFQEYVRESLRIAEMDKRMNEESKTARHHLGYSSGPVVWIDPAENLRPIEDAVYPIDEVERDRLLRVFTELSTDKRKMNECPIKRRQNNV